jgi:hypothetical protein
MTDELAAARATISQLRVTSRGSAMQFQGKSRRSTPEIAKTLNVDAVVEGSVSRSGNKVRITAQLIDARADKHRLAITRVSSPPPTQSRRPRQPPRKRFQLDSNSAEAHTSLAVFQLFYEFDWGGCEREFRRAIELNPNYAFAHDQFAWRWRSQDGSMNHSGKQARGGVGPPVPAGAGRCHHGAHVPEELPGGQGIGQKGGGA